jgi:hypothetical protein
MPNLAASQYSSCELVNCGPRADGNSPRAFTPADQRLSSQTRCGYTRRRTKDAPSLRAGKHFRGFSSAPDFFVKLLSSRQQIFIRAVHLVQA